MIFVSFVQPSKAFALTSVIPAGIVTDSKAVQSLNISLPIIPFPNVIEVKWYELLNTPVPTVSNEFGRTIDSR